MLSTHILDTCKGAPAAGVALRLERQEGQSWKELSSGFTNEDGRFSFECKKDPGIYRIVFEVEPYFIQEKKESFFPNVSVVFRVENTQRKYHVPLLLNPFGYSTYRGS